MEAVTLVAAGGPSRLIDWWAHAYNDTKAVGTAVTYLHFAGVLLGGGFAVVADCDVLRHARGPAALPPTLVQPADVHRWVLAGLAIVFATGVLMMLADLHTYATSAVFWTKMGLIVLLLGNGYGRVLAESAARRGAAAGWRWLRHTSVASLALWFAVLLASTMLTASS